MGGRAGNRGNVTSRSGAGQAASPGASRKSSQDRGRQNPNVMGPFLNVGQKGAPTNYAKAPTGYKPIPFSAAGYFKAVGDGMRSEGGGGSRGGGGGGSRGGGGYRRGPSAAEQAAARMAAAIAAANRRFNEGKAKLDKNRGEALGYTGQYFDEFNNRLNDQYGIHSRNTDQQNMNMYFQDLTSNATNKRDAEYLAQAAQANGVNPAYIEAMALNNQNQLRQQHLISGQTMDRLRNVTEGSQRDFKNSGALVRQGADSKIQQQYQDMLDALEAERRAVTG